MSKEYILQIKGISKKYLSKNGLETIALKDLSLDVEKNEMVAVMGSSGSGKTTLMNILTGLLPADEGEIIVRNQNLLKMTQDEMALFRRKNVGIVFQNYNLMDSLTIEENITVPLILDDVYDGQTEKVLEVSSLLGITGELKKYPYEISGGQQQRAGIARAVINNPRIIFADEPTGNLDADTTKRVMEYFVSVCQSKGTSLLMVTHDVKTASYCDRVVFLQDGKIGKELRKSSSSFYGAILDMQKEDEV